MGLQLHARAIAVPLYKNKEPVRVEAPTPSHMRAALGASGLQNSLDEADGAPAQARLRLQCPTY